MTADSELRPTCTVQLCSVIQKPRSTSMYGYDGVMQHAIETTLYLSCSLISGGGDVPGSIAIHDTTRPAGEKGLYVCGVTVSTYGT